MEKERELFDLIQEKRELDDFLSTLVEEAAVLDVQSHSGSVETLSLSAAESSFMADVSLETGDLDQEEPSREMKEEFINPVITDKLSTLDDNEFKLELRQPDPKFEDGDASVGKEKLPALDDEDFVLEMEKPELRLEKTPEEPGETEQMSAADDEFNPHEQKPELESAQNLEEPKHRDELLPTHDEQLPSGLTDTVSFNLSGETAAKSEQTSFGQPLDENEMVKEALPEAFVESEVQSLENSETLTPFDEVMSAYEQQRVKTFPDEELKPDEKLKQEKKKKARSKTGVNDFAPESKSKLSGKWLGIGIGALILLLIAGLAGYFWIYPERGGKTIDIIKSYITVFKTDQSAPAPSALGINLQQVRQKQLYNTTLMKNIRVIEGMAENVTVRPVSRIKIAANIYNAEGVLLATTESYAGNVVIDEKLENLNEQEIYLALKDVKTMEDRTSAKGQIPFMVVFTGEPLGIFRFTINPVDFKQH
jgi:hypothetical protein